MPAQRRHLRFQPRKRATAESTMEMTMRILALACLCFAASAFSASEPEKPTDEATRNLALLRQYGDLGRSGDYAAQAAMWAPDAINNGRPMSIDEIRSQLEDIHRVFPDHRSAA